VTAEVTISDQLAHSHRSIRCESTSSIVMLELLLHASWEIMVEQNNDVLVKAAVIGRRNGDFRIA